MQKPSTATVAHVVVDDEVSRRRLEIAELEVVVEVGQRTPSALDGSSARTHLGRRAGERLGRAHREPVRREPAAEVVEQRADAHDVGVQHDARTRGMPSGRAWIASTVDAVDARGS